jgi:hypothetical protein
MKSRAVALHLSLLGSLLVLPSAGDCRPGPAVPGGSEGSIRLEDSYGHSDVNHVDMWVSNVGPRRTTGWPGLEVCHQLATVTSLPCG